MNAYYLLRLIVQSDTTSCRSRYDKPSLDCQVLPCSEWLNKFHRRQTNEQTNRATLRSRT